MSIIKRKIIGSLVQETNKQEVEVEKVDQIVELITHTNSFFKKKNELILIEDHLITDGWDFDRNPFRLSYKFNNITENDLIYIIPYVYLNTSEGYAEYHQEGYPAWSIWSSTWWQQFKESFILHIVADGSVLYKSQRNIVPIYVTAKILLRNEKLFELTIKKAT